MISHNIHHDFQGSGEQGSVVMKLTQIYINIISKYLKSWLPNNKIACKECQVLAGGWLISLKKSTFTAHPF